jgi:Subtilisin-like serine proteases
MCITFEQKEISIMKADLNRHKINIAIIDSGIDINNHDLKSNIIGGIGFEYDIRKGYVTKTLDYQDENGHGTSCASIIKREVEDIGIFIIKILNKDCLTHSKVLIESLKYLLDIDIRLINLSVATTKELYRDELKRVCDLLFNQGKILICSLDNRSNKSYPAIFNNVIGVQGRNFNFTGDYWYNKKYEIQCVSDDIPVLAPGLNNSYRLFGRNSKATPLMSGKIAKIFTNKVNITFEELDGLLEQNAAMNYWSEEDLISNSIILDELLQEKYSCFKEEINILASIISGTFKMDNSYISLLYDNEYLRHPQIGLNPVNCYDLIKGIETQFRIKLNYNLINLNTFRTMYTLFDFILEEKNSVQNINHIT